MISGNWMGRIHLALFTIWAGISMAADFPIIEKLDPVPAKVGERLTITGKGFGGDRADGFGKVWVARCRSMPDAPGASGMMEYPRSRLLSWSDTKIEFVLPPKSAGVLALTGMSGRISPPLEFQIDRMCEDTTR